MNSVRKALVVLETVADLQPVGVSELAVHLKQPKSSVQRALETLHEAAWIRPASGERTRWELTFRASRLARKAGNHFGLREAALPVMEQLRRETGETIHLAVLDESEIVLIERLESPHAVRHVEPLGGRAPVLVTATGKAMLAQMPEADIERIYSEAVKADSQASAVSAALPLGELLVELRGIASRGYATTASWRDGVFATGAAISGPDRRPIAAISISTPAARATAEARTAHAELIVAAVSQIAEHLN
ncbi:transcriptional regulator (plasmid) [Aminobacter sp. Y103A]|jgi:IclR family acetate operon transcriptional repressor|uniref:IclR family acetate operon transcriptional repressor n=1 Tax=Aminobacter aminovorans TaxID=83263 RepID=A0AAC8YV73_AMIAI|nr:MULTISPECIES: IclR family transcriptional regulator [Aminobacter]AMS44783.1 Transcriptional regulator [Aminobacter aminovorans]MBB3704423.1 IclR family acetate operon transcriptional repressor [Aminobacter aminovorans]QNH37405.1 IclR family transcriptional regulator [Aminobacter sp. MDW-2]WMD00605.1 IclR family transcriptional regulator [Aminobacter niigataensis]BBD40904.1 transcriptional regulator [Aminobacter sp. SS-2016]